MTVEPPKGGRGRDGPVSAFVEAKMDLQGRGRTEWLFRGARSDRLDTHSWRARIFEPAAARAIGRMVPHELRHTAASLVSLREPTSSKFKTCWAIARQRSR